MLLRSLGVGYADRVQYFWKYLYVFLIVNEEAPKMIITNNPVFQPLSNIPINHIRLINGLFEGDPICFLPLDQFRFRWIDGRDTIEN